MLEIKNVFELLHKSVRIRMTQLLTDHRTVFQIV